MLIAIFSCGLLVALTTVIHYEGLRALNAGLPKLNVSMRAKLLVVIFATFVAHGLEIGVSGAALFILIKYVGIGDLSGAIGFSLANCLYFSVETYTSLGFGDMTPVGAVRLLAGVEALNGLLLIVWSASYTYIAMERFWNPMRAGHRS